ncbi:MAG TPA: hypothetical protein VF503_09695 [Sphingobium sp.]|uniref:hypothetical protein n=1 Tax=Sphingobium sp. TaxID=1912891 RepID=UPI002ED64BDD
MADGYSTKDGANRTTIIERRSGSGGLMIAMIVVIALVAVIAFFLFQQDAREQRQSDAVVGAARSVGDAAKDAARAVSDAADRGAPKN